MIIVPIRRPVGAFSLQIILTESLFCFPFGRYPDTDTDTDTDSMICYISYIVFF